MFARKGVKSLVSVLGVLIFTSLTIIGSNVLAKQKNQYCPTGQYMVGIDGDGNIVCELPPFPYAERYVFVTSTKHSGALGGIDGADLICTNLAIEANLYRGYEFKAWLANDSLSPSVTFHKSSVPYVNVYNDIIAYSYSDLTGEDWYLNNPINIDEQGNELLEQERVWTGVYPDGSINPNGNCQGWTYEGSNPITGSIVGLSDQLRDYWTFCETCYDMTCEEEHRIYCFEQ